MRTKPSDRNRYLNLSDAIKSKKIIDWCMKLLRVDIESMQGSEFDDFVIEYECIVAYPENIGYHFPPWHTIPEGQSIEKLLSVMKKEPDPRITFKTFQEAARKIMSNFDKMSNEPGYRVRWNTKMDFTVKADKKGIYSIDENVEHDLEYSFAWQIASFLKGRKFDDAFKKCAYKKCGNYFAVHSKHTKECCSHKCSVLNNNERLLENNKTEVETKRNLYAFVSRLKRQGFSDKQIKYYLENNIENNEYNIKHVPLSYKKKYLKMNS